MHSGDITLLVVFSVIVFVLYLIYTCWNFFFRGEIRNESRTDRLDLHDTKMDAALRKLEKFLNGHYRNAKRGGRYITSVTVLTGQGLCSVGNRPLLRQNVQEWLDNNGYGYDSHTGGFTVYLYGSCVPEWRHGTAICHLHGFDRLDAALRRLDEYLKWCRDVRSLTSVIVITGRGLHLIDDRPALRSAVQQWLYRHGYSFESHDGGFIVYM